MCLLCTNKLLPAVRVSVNGVGLTEIGVNAVIENLKKRNEILSEENRRLRRAYFDIQPRHKVNVYY